YAGSFGSANNALAACVEPSKRGVRRARFPSRGMFSHHGQSRLEIQKSRSKIKAIRIVAREGAVRRRSTQGASQSSCKAVRKGLGFSNEKSCKGYVGGKGCV